MTAATITAVREIRARLEPYEWAWARENRERIAAHWARRLAERPAMFDGTVLLVSAIDETDGALDVRFFATPFSNFLTLRDFGFPDPTVANAFAAAVPRTADGAFLLGQMAPHTASAGQVYFPCGTPDMADVRADGSVDLAGSALREFEEETGFSAAASDAVWTVVRDGGYLAFLRPIALSQDAEAARGRILAHLAAEAEPELSDIVVARSPRDIDPATMPPFVQVYLADAFARAS